MNISSVMQVLLYGMEYVVRLKCVAVCCSFSFCFDANNASVSFLALC
jgi:hypothetical protein